MTVAGVGWLLFTVGAYAVARAVYARSRLSLLNPAVVTIGLVILALRATGTTYARYDDGGRVLSFLLGPAVVALGVPLAAQLAVVRRQARAVAGAILTGAVVGSATAMLVALALGASAAVVRSLAPRAVTTPIALAVSERVGGVPALSAVIVIATGMFGGVVGPPLLRRLGVRSREAVGLALGASSHGLGTARAVEEGEVEGAMSGLAMGLTGVTTALLAPPLVALLARLFPGRM